MKNKFGLITKLKLALISTFLLTQTILNPVFAAEEAGSFVDDSLRDMSIVMGAGAAGAVLGLSTLSFVEEPSKHMKNIAVGGAIGIVVGVAVVVFSQATRPNQFSEQKMNDNQPLHFAKYSDKTIESFEVAPKFDWKFTF